MRGFEGILEIDRLQNMDAMTGTYFDKKGNEILVEEIPY